MFSDQIEKMGLKTLILAILFSCVVNAAAAVEPLDHDPCQRKCGDIHVPYPFGLGNSGCFKDSNFELTCNPSLPDPLIHGRNIPLLNISLEEGTAVIRIGIAYSCYDNLGAQGKYLYQRVKLIHSPFTFSSTANKFMAFGCDTFGLVSAGDVSTGCISTCSSDPINIMEVHSCSGIGCCQTSIPRGLKTLNISFGVLNFGSNRPNTCDYGFLAGTNFSLKMTPEGNYSSEIVLDWAIGNMKCEEANDNICGPNTNCTDSTNGLGYRCFCKEGYTGNPYTETGCTDINECLPEYGDTYSCKGTCQNTPGSYTCHCSFGSEGDGKVGCRLKTSTTVLLAIGASVFLTSLALFVFWLYQKKVQKRNHRKNGGLLLEHLSVKSFKQTQLEKATNNFDAQRLLGEGGNGWVYRGLLADMIDIAVKKSKVVDQNQIEQFLNEADIVSKINHKNVVKLLGVCLESKVPMLVYEFVPNGTLHHHIHGSYSRILNSWRICLRIVAETARALDYMHSLAHPPIIHRDVKSSNILLDGTYTAKVSDFGASKLIPLDRTIAPTQGQGTLGYLDPEYLQTGELTTKSDVYGFGVVLMELLCKQRPLSRGVSGEMISLVKVFTSATKNNQLDQVLKVAEATEHETEQVHLVAKLAVECVAMPSKDRPTMTEVADVLNGLSKEYRSFQVEESVGHELVGLLDDQEIVTSSVHFELE